MTDTFLSIKEAAELAGVSKKTVERAYRKHLDDPNISHLIEKRQRGSGFSYFVTRSFVDRCIRKRSKKPRVTDLDEQAVLLRERKRVRGKRSFRRVPLSDSLKAVLKAWFENHPGGPHTFCKSTFGEIVPLTRDDASGYFERTLRDSKWSVIPGWHCFRHSFISNCAMKGVDQRIIDTWVGHQTDEMRRRYRHLFPDTEQAAMKSVFS